MTVFLVVAVSENNVIGIDNQLPWKVPMDLKWFKMNTMHGAIIMGRKTWDSIPKKPLPNRTNIIISRQAKPKDVQVHWYNQLKMALQYSTRKHRNTYIIGGSDIFHLGMPAVNVLLVTRIHKHIEHDQPVIFKWPTDFDRIWHSKTFKQNGIEFHFEMYRRKSLSCIHLHDMLHKHGL